MLYFLNMEFEPEATVSNEARLLAQTKQLTLQPDNPFLKPQDTPDPITITETHANILPDTENTSNSTSLIHASEKTTINTNTASASRAPLIAGIVCLSALLGTIAGVSYFFIIG